MRRLMIVLQRIKEKVWFYPVLYSIQAVLIAVVCIGYDMDLLPWGQGLIPGVLTTNIDLGRTILTMVGTAFITVTTFTFSTTMVVLTMYTSQYSPRVIRNFLLQKETLQSFGVFVSGFLYVMVVLLFLSNYPDGQRMVSATVSIGYILAALVYFFRFINSVVTHIQADTLIQRLKKNALREINRYRSRIGDAEQAASLPEGDWQTHPWTSTHDGYIQDIDIPHLQNTAGEKDMVIVLRKVHGQFITQNTVIGEYWHGGDIWSEEEHASIHKKLAEAIVMGEHRQEINDFAYSIQKMVEVAVKALSPGINDPYTAIHCIRILAVLFRDLAELHTGFYSFSGKAGENGRSSGKVYIEAEDFDLLLMNSCQPIIQYGRGDFLVMQETIKLLQTASSSASPANRMVIQQFSSFLWQKIDEGTFVEREKEILKQEIEEVDQLTRFSLA